MSEASAALQEVLGAAFWYEMDNIYTSIPCVVIAVRDGTMVDIQPTINQRFVDDRETRRAPILGVPISYPISSNAGVLFPVKVGTTGMAIFSMRNMDNWKRSGGGFVPPSNRGKFDKSDAVFFPGIQPPSVNLANPSQHGYSHSTDDTVVFNNIGSGNGNEVRLTAGGDIIINTPNKVEVNCNDAEVNASSTATVNTSSASVNASSSVTLDTPQTTVTGNMLVQGMLTFTGGMTGSSSSGSVATINGSLDASGDVVAGGVSLRGHTHSGVETGDGNTGTPN